MFVTQTTKPSARLLHIRPEACSRADEVSAWIGDAGFGVEVRADVYSGLAALGRMARAKVAVVSVDVLDGLEFEFFGLAARLKPEIVVLVYGRAASDVKLEQAIARGAAERATPFALRTLAARFSEIDGEAIGIVDEDATADEEVEEEIADEVEEYAVTEMGEVVENFADDASEAQAIAEEPLAVEAAGPFVEEVFDESDESESSEIEVEEFDATNEVTQEDEPTSPARVPWVKASDEPERKPPMRTPPKAPEGQLPPRLHPVPVPRSEDDMPRGSSEERESLLSPEELAALLGDEFEIFASRKSRRERGGS